MELNTFLFKQHLIENTKENLPILVEELEKTVVSLEERIRVLKEEEYSDSGAIRDAVREQIEKLKKDIDNALDTADYFFGEADSLETDAWSGKIPFAKLIGIKKKKNMYIEKAKENVRKIRDLHDEVQKLEKMLGDS